MHNTGALVAAWLAGMMAEHIAIAFENARLCTIATTEDLTGLFTRRHFDTCCAIAFERVQDEGRSLSFLMAACDDDDAINQVYPDPDAQEPGT